MKIIKMKILKIVLAILFITTFAWADEKIVGHVEPLPEELLPTPIDLKNCPIDIYEWRSKNKSEFKAGWLGEYCELTIQKFNEFVALKGLKKAHNEPYEGWKVSIIPDNREYRSLNDLQYRFAARSQYVELWGYTHLRTKYIFLANEATPPFWAHELFHSLSVHYGIYEAHHPYDISIRIKEDEKLAREFTVWLGLGKS